MLSTFLTALLPLALLTPVPSASPLKPFPPTEDLSDPIPLVSSFYGPGALVSWLLVVLSVLIDRLSTPGRPPPNNQRPAHYAHILGLDLNLLSALAYPCAAAVNVLLYAGELQSGELEPVVAARVAAPLAVLRIWTGLGPWLIGAWIVKLSRPVRHPSIQIFGRRVRNDVGRIIGWVALLFGGRHPVLAVRMLSQANKMEGGLENFHKMAVIIAVFQIIWGANMVGEGWLRVKRNTMSLFGILMAVWTFGVTVEGLVDAIYWRQLWTEASGELGERQTTSLTIQRVAFYSVLGSMGRRSRWDPEGTEEYLSKLIAAKANLKDNHLRTAYTQWQVVDQFQRLLWRFEEDPQEYVVICRVADDLIQAVATGVGLIFALVGLFIMLRAVYLLPQKVPSKIHPWSKTLAKFFLYPTLLGGPSVIGLAIVVEVLLRLAIPLTRPDLMLTVTRSNWTDLDQITALVLNGCLPLILSSKMAIPNYLHPLTARAKGAMPNEQVNEDRLDRV
ncbi:MAG: hypothetical protein MMC23_005718 [Stictis urceolatum]|nr:hypothetical protein [Stictis urceolata]